MELLRLTLANSYTCLPRETEGEGERACARWKPADKTNQWWREAARERKPTGRSEFLVLCSD